MHSWIDPASGYVQYISGHGRRCGNCEHWQRWLWQKNVKRMMTMCTFANSYMYWASHVMQRHICTVYRNLRWFCVKAEGTAIDGFLSRLCKHKNLHQMPVTQVKKNNLFLQYNKQSERRHRHRIRCDEICDKKLQELIHSKNLEGALAVLIRYADVDRYPSKKILGILAAAYAKENNLDAILKVKTITKKAYPREYEYEMEYKHYIAEALWKDGRYKEAITLFHQILLQYKERTKKISDMITFLTRHLVKNNHVEELHFLVKIMRSCVHYGIHQPLANVWQQLFLSEVIGQQIMSDNVMRTCDPLTKKLILNKGNSIILMAKTSDRIDLLQRYAEVVLHFQHQPYYSKVFSALLNHQCDIGNVNGALTTFQYMVDENIVVEKTVCNKLMFLLGYHHKKAPEALLKMKYNIPPNKTVIYAF